jgi:hypothetical protein
MKSMRFFGSTDCVGLGRHADSSGEDEDAFSVRPATTTTSPTSLTTDNINNYSKQLELNQSVPNSLSSHSHLKNRTKSKRMIVKKAI